MTRPAFLPSADRVRNSHFDESMENAEEFLRSPHAISAMGAEAIEQYTDVFRRTRLPNFKNQVIDITHFDQDEIPFVPVLKDETLCISDQYMKPTSKQRQTIESQFGKKLIKRTWDKCKPVIEIIKDQEFDEGSFDIRTLTLGVYVKPVLRSKEKWGLYGRPMIEENNDRRISHYTPVLIHEWTHVLQYEEKPIHKVSDAEILEVSNEFGAYMREEQAYEAWKYMGREDEMHSIEGLDKHQEYALGVLAICKSHNHSLLSGMPSKEMIEDFVKFDTQILKKPTE